MTDLKTKQIDEAFEMGAEQFRAWRKSLGLKQKEAADRLGLKKRMIQYYEKGNRDGKAVKIPKTVRLACYALSHNILDFDGEQVSKGPVVPDGGEPIQVPFAGPESPSEASQGE